MKKNKITIIVLGVIIFLIFFSTYFCVYAETFTFTDTIEPGTIMDIPQEIPQYKAQVESYVDGNPPGNVYGTAQYDVRQLLWEKQNRPVADNNIAIVEVAGQKRYLVALASTFGWSGDYIDIVLEDGEIIPCLMGDAKSAKDKENEHNKGAYFYNGVHYGHTYGDNQCDIAEFILGTEYGGDNYANAPSDFLNKFDKIAKIVNGGSYFLHKDGPVGLDGNYGSISSKNHGVSNGSVSFSKKLGQFFRRVWIGVSTLYESDRTGHNFSSIMISLSE